jgi:hypothetical protein
MGSLCKSPKAPPAPDYAAAATAQGAANLKSGVQTAGINNPNIISPYGNQTVTWDMSNPDMPTPTITQTLTPDAQAALNSQQRVQKEFADLANQGINTAKGIIGTPFKYEGPGIQTSFDQGPGVNYGPKMGEYGMAQGVDASQFGQNRGVNYDQFGQASGMGFGQYGQAGSVNADAYGRAGSVNSANYGQSRGINYGDFEQARSLGAGDFGLANAINANEFGLASGMRDQKYGQAQRNLNLSGVANMPVNAGMTGQQAILQRLAPQMQRQREGLRTQLVNQGFRPGTEAYNRAMEQQGQQENDMFTQAAMQGIGLDMSANQQGFGQAATKAGLYNQGLGQDFGQGLAALQATNQSVAQNFGQGLSSQQLKNAAVSQNFGQGLQAQQLRNQAIDQNMRNALMAQNSQNDAINQNFGRDVTSQQLTNQSIGQNFGQGVTAQQLSNQAIGQNFGQGSTERQMANQAIGQNFGQGVTAQQMQNDAINANLANAMSAQGMNNAAMQQNYAQAGNIAGLYNSAAAQQYNQNMQGAQFGNNASDQALARALQLRNQPINEINALMEGSQIQNPQFQGYTGANVNAAPTYQAVGDAANYGMNIYGQRMAARNANVNAVGQAVGTVGTAIAMSDMRLKSNIERVGTHANGVGVYEYDIDGHRERGVMAQEVLNVKPEAVLMGDDGFYMVNYGAL